MITAESLVGAVDKHRAELSRLIGATMPLSYSEVARQIGVHSSVFSRLKKGDMPSEKLVGAILTWLGDEKLAHCDTCPDLLEDDPENFDEEEVEELNPLAAKELEEIEEAAADEGGFDSNEKVQAVYAVGRLSESEDPETQSIIARAKELLREGAVGVSVALDMHPDDAKIVGEAAVDEETGELQVPDGFVPRQRIRHTAIVGTPAMADARLELHEDGTVSGLVTFQNEWTGDLRKVDYGSIDLEATRTPSPIIYNRDLEGHEGPTIGFIDSFEVREVPPTSERFRLNDEAITAAFAPMELPAAYFAQTVPTRAEPIRISKPDAQGYRAIRGLAAPKGVCHRSNRTCFTYPKDPDPQLKGFHTGTLLRLDDGADIRVGALTIGGGHIDASLARQGVSISQVSNHRDDANRVFALVRAWETRFGLMIAGAIPPDVSDADVARALACSPSVELWPDVSGRRTLIGIHLVGTPAWPVTASVGSAEFATTHEPIQVEDADELSTEEADVEEAEVDGEPDPILNETLFKAIQDLGASLESFSERLAGLESKSDAILSLIPIEDIPIE